MGVFCSYILRVLCCSGSYWLHSNYSASHARETHAGCQCADQRNVNNALDAQNTHKTHNSFSGGEIKTIQTGWKILTCCICLGGPFATGPVSGARPLDWACSKRLPEADSVTDFPASLYCVCLTFTYPVQPSYLFSHKKISSLPKMNLFQYNDSGSGHQGVLKACYKRFTCYCRHPSGPRHGGVFTYLCTLGL